MIQEDAGDFPDATRSREETKVSSFPLFFRLDFRKQDDSSLVGGLNEGG